MTSLAAVRGTRVRPASAGAWRPLALRPAPAMSRTARVARAPVDAMGPSPHSSRPGSAGEVAKRRGRSAWTCVRQMGVSTPRSLGRRDDRFGCKCLAKRLQRRHAGAGRATGALAVG
jgi:hypothetical protein